MEIQASRAAARVSNDGELVLLMDQDRTLWDRGRIDRGLSHLSRALTMPWPGAYVAEAEIAPSPVVELNRAVAVSMVEGPEAALVIVDALGDSDALRGYHLLPAVRADLLRRLGRHVEAAAEYRRATTLTANEKEKAFLQRRLAECAAMPPRT